MAKRILIIIAVVLIVAGLMGVGGVVAALYYFQLGPFARDEIVVSRPPAQPAAPPADAGNALTDLGHYQTENNWIAATIAQELTGLCWLAAHPNGPVPTFDVKATVDPHKGLVHLEINGWIPDTPITADLTPAYAWDPAGYAALARQLMGDQKNSEPATADASDLLNDLLTPTGKTLATEDVALSGALLQSPASAALHDKAALLLLTVAMRENAGILSDSRRLLCRATAHLALAQALRGSDQPGWPGKVANAALLTLSGRETDALAQINTLSAASDATDAAKLWFRVLRLVNKNDWRIETPDGQSPLLLKIAWFQAVASNLGDALAVAYLDRVSPLAEVPDWGRALLGNNESTSVEVGHRFCESTIALEFKELTEILAAENSPATSGDLLAKVFNDPIHNTVYIGFDGKNNIAVVGTAIFKDISLRQLFLAVNRTHFWMKDSWGVPDDDAKFIQQISSLFHGVPHEKYLSLFLQNKNSEGWLPSNGLKADLADIPPGFAFSIYWPGSDGPRLSFYYAWGIPFNAPYAMTSRATLVYDAHFAPGNGTPTAPPSFSDLKSLAPDSYTTASWTILTKLDRGGSMTRQDEQALLSPFFDYDTFSLSYFKSLSEKQSDFDAATIELILRKQCALDPDEYFNLGIFLRTQGRVDEAAAADRNGAAQANDQVLMANSIQPLVEYDFAHDQQGEAMQLAEKAADVYSSPGIETYIWVLMKLNRVDEAEEWAKKEGERYGSNDLAAFYAKYRDRLPDKYKQFQQSLFPNGLQQVTLSSFSGAPKSGCQITSDSAMLRYAGLRPNDVIVALDSYEVTSEDTYYFIRALTQDPHMDLIVCRDGTYLEIKASASDRRFGVELSTYTAQ